MFKLSSKFKPAGDQPEAIEKLSHGLDKKRKNQTLVGVTGSGKTYTLANVIAHHKKPTLVISHNKTLAAQLYQEFKDFFPDNAVHYFVSYYDYYQPEAYIPHSDTYIEKDAKINEEIDRLRHAATQALLSRDDVIIVASVSCIYNLGDPESYEKLSLHIHEGQTITPAKIVDGLKRLQYPQDIELKRGTFRKSSNEIEIVPATGDQILKLKFAYDRTRQARIDAILLASNVDLEKLDTDEPNFKKIAETKIYPAKYWVTNDNKVDLAIANIKAELDKHIKHLKKGGFFLEADRLKERTERDMQMLKSTGYCYGIENYSMQLEFREPGAPPYTLIDYFKRKGDFLTIVDESHLTIPQIHGMQHGDHSRKATLVEHGFRLPSALDNRPLRFGEFEKLIQETIYMSATPKPYELKKSGKEGIVEQLVRPTGLLDPTIEIRPTADQVPHLIAEIKKRVVEKQRILVTTLTKRMAEDLTDFLADEGIKVNYIHSDIKTLQRLEILHDLRLGNYDVIVGVNLLREGLDLPEVSLVAILDADKEGFLRNATTLIQTMGRAARHLDGHVIMYADKITKSMDAAMKETDRRRNVQIAYNKKHHITPASIIKAIKKTDLPSSQAGNKEKISKWYSYSPGEAEDETKLPIRERIERMTKQMERAVHDLQFEKALWIREQILALKKQGV
ncbi:MAG: excinuclease ABC subunit B [Candidatus Yanofskybacteria bacterium RIFCSPLOWO2_01_FULL_49_25]|uniref:UvrABC system protein B n=1 Tax=Candidatus Yanofskybacteria bacterium RIFCSPLOWO2_01_FULL_49_25 TaxID=1802701 RepID=A0A1F8GTV7_9BACT|nr:MAG: excinuclease ABC subunit B [Candidatus Yanofskybacteria bacterium RIFCSPLOWO2_01_FULL_49_25]